MTTRGNRGLVGLGVFVAIFALLLLGTHEVTWSDDGSAQTPAEAHPSPICPGLGNPHATLTVWETQPDLGFDPVEGVEDPLSLSGYFSGADGPTLVTAYENTTCNNLPCGITWWAPDINRFRCMGFGGGINTAISLDTGGPDILLPDQDELNDPATPGGPFDHVGLSVGTGSIWTFGFTNCPVAVTLRGDQSGADGAGGTGGFARTRAWPVGQAWGGDLDEATGLAYYTDPGTFCAGGSVCVRGPFP